MAEENQGGFKVTDRRLFNADGSVREDILAEQAATAAAAPVEPPPATRAPQAQPEPAFEAGRAPEHSLSEEDLHEMPEQTMFTDFLMNIASSAFVYLGLVEHPATRRREVNLEAAKDTIDLLVMLREKTKGNLIPGEEKFFEDLLSDLKMQFVSMRR